MEKWNFPISPIFVPKIGAKKISSSTNPQLCTPYSLLLPILEVSFWLAQNPNRKKLDSGQARMTGWGKDAIISVVMKKKKFIIIVLVVLVTGLGVGYFIWASQRANYYLNVSRETSDKQEEILDLEKSVALHPRTENIIPLADLYISINRNDLAERIMVGRGEVQILNKLGNLYLDENKTIDAENAFTKAENKTSNPDSLKGLVLVELKKGDRGVAEDYLRQLTQLDSDSANCYASFVYLNDFKKSENDFEEAKECNLYGLDKYFKEYKAGQNPLFLKLEAANEYYANNYLALALSDTLALRRENSRYRDAYILAAKIYEKLGDQKNADDQKQKAFQIDPTKF